MLIWVISDVIDTSQVLAKLQIEYFNLSSAESNVNVEFTDIFHTMSLKHLYITIFRFFTVNTVGFFYKEIHFIFFSKQGIKQLKQRAELRFCEWT